MTQKVLAAFRFTLLATLCFLGQSEARAAVLILYPFTGSSPASTDTDLFSTATSITPGSGVTLGYVTGGGGAWGNPLPAGAMLNATGVTQADAVTGNDYFQFTLTANSGYVADLVNLTLDSRKNDASGNGRFFVRSSLDGYASDLYLSPLLSNTTTLSSNIDLSAPAFQDLAAITFRIYGYGSAGGSLRMDNITLNGLVTAVPEPSTGVLLFAAAGLVVLRRRRG